MSGDLSELPGEDRVADTQDEASVADADVNANDDAPVTDIDAKAADSPRLMGDVDPEIVENLVETFSQLSDGTRLRLILMLHDGEMNVTAMCEKLGQSQPAVSHHLALLRTSGFLKQRRAGKHNFYTLGRRWTDAMRQGLLAMIEEVE